MDGSFIEENARYGKRLYSWLGYETFDELAISALSWPLHQSFKTDPVVRTTRLLRHTLLYWLSEYWKSSMINIFCDLLNQTGTIRQDWKIHRLGHATPESIRGSVTGYQGQYVYHPPDLLLGEIVKIPEFHSLVTASRIDSVIMDWTSQGEISLSLVKASAAFSDLSVQTQAERYGVTVANGRMHYTTDALMIAACHIEENRIIQRFPDAFWNRPLILYHLPERFDTNLRLYVDLHTDHLRDNIDHLREGWRFYHRLRVDGNLPVLSEDWIRRFHDEFPELGPRMGDLFRKTLYSHAFAMQPLRHGFLAQSYPNLILDVKDLEFALERMPRYERGLNFIRMQQEGNTVQGETRDDLMEYLRNYGTITTEEAAKELGCSERWARKILKRLEGEGLVEKIGVTKGSKWRLKI